MRRTDRGRGLAVVAVLPLLITAVACKSGGADGAKSDKGAGHPVYGEKLGRQLVSAREVTEKSGSARFTYTLTYTTKSGTVRDVTTGAQDYGKKTADATRTLTLPGGLPAKTGEQLGARPGKGPEAFEVTGSDVAYRTRSGAWLRYAASGSKEFVDRAGVVLSRAGDEVPYGGTLADTIAHAATPVKQPVVGSDGSRVYATTASARSAAEALPADIGFLVPMGKDEPAPVPLTIKLDAEGRITEGTADYAPVLTALHKAGALREVTALKAVYRLTDHGKAVPRRTAGASAEDAEKVLTDLHAVPPGACASDDTGLGSQALVRVGDCTGRSDLRVFGHVKVDKTSRDELTMEDGETAARDLCRAKFATVPAAWVAKARPKNSFLVTGDSALEMAYSPGGDNRVSGEFTCYVSTTG